MLSGNTILILALLFYIIDFLAITANRQRFANLSLVAAASSVMLATGFFSWSFLTDDFLLKAVYAQSSRALPPLLKLSASWTGSGGSLLLWSVAMTIALLIFQLKTRSSLNSQRKATTLVMSFFTMVVIGFTLATNPFSQLTVSVPDGVGQNPSLQSTLSMIHPPLVFAAYATLLLCYSLVLGREWAPKGATANLDDRIIWTSWVLLTMAISVGGFWAYQTLGWGGYWAWDPLETSALIPWLFLTALLFSKLVGHSGRRDLFSVTFTASSLFLTVYIARSAAVPSVHGYGTFLGGSSILLVALLPAFLSLSASRRRRTDVLEVKTAEDNSPESDLVFWTLTVIASADLILLLYTALGPLVGATFSAGPQMYNDASFPMLTVLLAAIFTKCLKERQTYRIMFSSFAFLFVVGFGLFLVKFPSGNALADVGLPFVFGLLGTAGYRVTKWAFQNRPHFHPRSDIKYLAFLGVALLLLGVFVSSSMQVSRSEIVRAGQSFDAFGLELSVRQISTYPSAQQIFLPPYGMVPESVDSRITYTSSDDPSVANSLFLKYYPALDRYVPTVSIQHTFLEDIYIVAGSTESVRQTTALVFGNRSAGTPFDVRITVTLIPAVSLVWLGTMLLVGANLPVALKRNAPTER
jgi:cytochrome c biogenesis factor